MKYILNKEKQDLVISSLLSNEVSEITEICDLVDGCKHYYFSIYGNTYFLAKTIQQGLAHNNSNPEYVDKICELMQTTNLFVEEVDSDFIDFLLKSHSSDEDLDIEIFKSYESYINRYHS